MPIIIILLYFILIIIFVVLVAIYRAILIYIRYKTNPDPLFFESQYHLFYSARHSTNDIDDNYADDIERIGLSSTNINFTLNDQFSDDVLRLYLKRYKLSDKPTKLHDLALVLCDFHRRNQLIRAERFLDYEKAKLIFLKYRNPVSYVASERVVQRKIENLSELKSIKKHDISEELSYRIPDDLFINRKL